MSKNGSVEIEMTEDYDVFKKMSGNRPIDEAHVSRLMKSMKQNDLFVPIMVNKKMQVVDGQHRLEARKRLNLIVPYFIVGDYDLESVQTINAQQKKWSIADFTESFIALGNKEYEIYKWFRGRYKLPHGTTVQLLMGGEISNDGTGIMTIFQTGAFKVKNLEDAKKKAEMLEKVAPYFPQYNSRGFVSAMIKLFGKKSFDFKKFLNKLEIQPRALKNCATTELYIDLIEEIYNYKSQTKVSLKYGD